MGLLPRGYKQLKTLIFLAVAALGLFLIYRHYSPPVSTPLPPKSAEPRFPHDQHLKMLEEQATM